MQSNIYSLKNSKICRYVHMYAKMIGNYENNICIINNFY